MRFVAAMVARELRASGRRLLLFFLSLAIGVAAIVALRSIIQNIRTALDGQARTLTAADLVIDTNRPWTDEARRILDARLAAAPVAARLRSIETNTMVRPEGNEGRAATMVELRAVEAGFPFYGRLVLASGRPFSHDLLAGRGALVAPELLTRLGVAVGDRILVGETPFTIRDTIVREPGRSLSVFRLGPRVLVDYGDLLETGIVRFGSRVRFQELVRMADGAPVGPLARRLEEELAGTFVRVRTYRDTGDRVARRLARTEDYLSLAGFVILILGGIGVWSVVRVFVHQRLRSAAILKCLGASTRAVLAVYTAQVVLLGLVGSLAGVGLARLGLLAVPQGLAGDLETGPYGLTTAAVVQGVGVGLVVSLLFSSLPLLELRRVRPLALLRPSHEDEPRRGTDAARWVAAGLLAVALVALAVWQAGSLRVGLYVSGGFVACAAVLHGAGALLVRVLDRLARRARFPVRHAVLALSRPGSPTRVVLLAVGLGCFFLLAMHTVERSLLGRLDVELRDDAPDMFVIDVQRDQAEPLLRKARSLGAERIRLVPVLRARVTGVFGRRVRLDGYEEVREHGSLGREYVVTYRDRLEENERIVAGRFWDRAPSAEPEVSIEESLHERYGIDVGDRIRFDVLGRSVVATVTSLREVEWSDARNGGFMFVFRPGALDAAPHTYLGFVKGPPGLEERARFQRDLVADFANVTIVDLHQVLLDLRAIVDRISVAVGLVGGIALATGVLILMGSLVMTKYQRRYETAILRTLGARRRSIAALLFVEYGTLGLLAGIVGALGAGGLSWVLTERVLALPWTPAPLASLVGAVATALGVALLGTAATADVVRQKPLLVLRSE